jgi:ribosomal protein S12 methylthiotransferase
MKARVSRKVALDRKDQVMKLQSAIWKYKAKRMIGNTYLALVVAPGVARMESQAPEVDGVVYVDSDSVGEFVNVKLKRVKGYDFVGEIV